jgi:hypothetical protein
MFRYPQYFVKVIIAPIANLSARLQTNKKEKNKFIKKTLDNIKKNEYTLFSGKQLSTQQKRSAPALVTLLEVPGRSSEAYFLDIASVSPEW